MKQLIVCVWYLGDSFFFAWQDTPSRKHNYASKDKEETKYLLV